MQNAFIDSFNGRLRDELLNETLFSTLGQAGATLSRWRSDDNGSRPHSALGWPTPATFHPRRDLRLREPESSAPDPAAHPADKAKSNRQNKLNAG